MSIVAQDERLIHRLREIHGNRNTAAFGVLDFASAFGSPLEALTYSRLFWPDFIEFEGMVFPAAVFESEQDQARARAALARSGSRGAAERALNRFEIPSDFFASHRVPTTDEENRELAERMAQTWRARLTQLFPNRTFTVAVEHAPDEPPTLTFFQCECTARISGNG